MQQRFKNFKLACLAVVLLFLTCVPLCYGASSVYIPGIGGQSTSSIYCPTATSYSIYCVNKQSANGYQNRLIFSIGGTYSWTVPTGVTSVFVVVVGDGGNGGPYMTYWIYAGGGGGYAERVIGVTPGQNASIVVRNGGSNGQVTYITLNGVTIQASGGQNYTSYSGLAYVNGGCGSGGTINTCGGVGWSTCGGGGQGVPLRTAVAVRVAEVASTTGSRPGRPLAASPADISPRRQVRRQSPTTTCWAPTAAGGIHGTLWARGAKPLPSRGRGSTPHAADLVLPFMHSLAVSGREEDTHPVLANVVVFLWAVKGAFLAAVARHTTPSIAAKAEAGALAEAEARDGVRHTAATA